MAIKLSICIATFKRGQFIGTTLDSILSQMEPGVEIVVVDGASPDNTPEVMAEYVRHHPEIRYIREAMNSGVDADFDKAVSYAQGEFCWLMTDDDLLRPGAIATVLSALGDEDDLIVVNSEVRNVDLSTVFESRRLAFDADRSYRAENSDAFFSEVGGYLSFIGCVVIRRGYWLSRPRSEYYGSLFIHVGVIFHHPPLFNVKVIAEPLIIIRYGNAMWTSRSFEIWMFKWPGLVWSFPDFAASSKRKICRREPWQSAKALFHNRALGAYNLVEFRKLPVASMSGKSRLLAWILSIFPARLANAVMVCYFSRLAVPAEMALHDLLFSNNAGGTSRFLARVLRRGKS